MPLIPICDEQEETLQSELKNSAESSEHLPFVAENIELAPGDLSTESGILRNYIKQVFAVDNLTETEEKDYCQRWIENKDTEAAKILVTSHLKLVVKIALQFRSYGLSIMEMIAEGNLGLIRAVQKFDLAKNCRLVTYALWHIKASIQEYILKSWSIVKVATTKAQRNLFFAIKSLKQKIMNHSESNESGDVIKNIAQRFHVDEKLLTDMNHRMMPIVSLNDTLNGTTDELQEMLPNADQNQEVLVLQRINREHKLQLIKEAFLNLNDREKLIVHGRYLLDQPVTLDVLSKKLQISIERVRQLEKAAMQKIIGQCRERITTKLC